MQLPPTAMLPTPDHSSTLCLGKYRTERKRNGFRKNKSMEKQPESEENLLEHCTDGTDAFDTLYIDCEKFPQHDLYPISVGGVR